MPYSDPSLALQKAFVAALKADPGVNAIVAGRVYDGVPTNATKPYISFGPFQLLPEHGDCLDGGEAIIQVDGWSTGPATVQAKQLGAAISLALDEADLALDGQHLVDLAVNETNYLRDPDGITVHAVITVHAWTEPASPNIPVGYPTAGTAGVQDGVTLTPRGDWDINASGTYQNMDVTGYVFINADNVTLRNCRVMPVPGQVSHVVGVATGKTGVIIEYCDINGNQVPGLKGILFDGSVGSIARFNDISYAEDGIFVWGNSHEIRDNYVHDLISGGSDPHHDCLQIGGQGVGIIIDHNTLIGATFANACLQFGNADNNVSVTINNNVMRPGPDMLYLLNCGDTAVGGHTCVWNVTNNRFEPGHVGGTGNAGTKCATWNVNAPTTWTGNTDIDTGTTIPFPA